MFWYFLKVFCAAPNNILTSSLEFYPMSAAHQPQLSLPKAKGRGSCRQFSPHASWGFCAYRDRLKVKSVIGSLSQFLYKHGVGAELYVLRLLQSSRCGGWEKVQREWSDSCVRLFFSGPLCSAGYMQGENCQKHTQPFQIVKIIGFLCPEGKPSAF